MSNVERNDTVSGLILNGLAASTSGLDRARNKIIRLKSAGPENIDWSHLKTLIITEDLSKKLSKELESLIDFAREYGLEDFEVAKTVIQNVSPELKARLVPILEEDLELTKEQKQSLLEQAT